MGAFQIRAPSAPCATSNLNLPHRYDPSMYSPPKQWCLHEASKFRTGVAAKRRLGAFHRSGRIVRNGVRNNHCHVVHVSARFLFSCVFKLRQTVPLRVVATYLFKATHPQVPRVPHVRLLCGRWRCACASLSSNCSSRTCCPRLKGQTTITTSSPRETRCAFDESNNDKNVSESAARHPLLGRDRWHIDEAL